MARLCLTHLLVIVAIGVLGASGAVPESVEFPSFDTALGSKLAIADDYYDGDDGGSDEGQQPPPPPPPKPCCFPAIWQGRAVHEFAVGARSRAGGRRGKGPMLSRAVDQFYVDGANSRLAGDMVEFRGHRYSVNFSWIFSVGANRTGDYYIFNKAEKKCQHRSLHDVVFRRQCLPANASYGGSFALGPAGGLSVQSWSFGSKRRAPAIDGDNHLFPRPGVAFGADILVVPTTCIPVVLQEHGFIFRGIDQQQDGLSRSVDAEDSGVDHYQNYIRRMLARTTTARPDVDRGHQKGVGFTSSAYLSNVYTHIADPSVFDVPSYCKKSVDNTLRHDDQLPTILERFILL